MNNPVFQGRWAQVVKTRQEELIAIKLQQSKGNDEQHDDDELAIQHQAVDLIKDARGSKGIDRCAPNTKEYWDAFAAQLVKQYNRLIVEPRGASALATEIAAMALNDGFKGEANTSTVIICLEADNLQENSNRPVEHRPIPTQLVISKLLQGAMVGRGGIMNEDGQCCAPGEQDIMMLIDGGRETCKAALPVACGHKHGRLV
jgi:hypothetical protein